MLTYHLEGLDVQYKILICYILNSLCFDLNKLCYTACVIEYVM